MRIFGLLILLLFIAADADARSAKARSDFVKTHPCPLTGKTKGACYGWQVDHIKPLKCGGADAPNNMQWLTTAAHKAKTKREAKMCLKPREKRERQLNKTKIAARGIFTARGGFRGVYNNLKRDL